MEIKAEARNLRLTSRKARLVLDLVRGKKATEALDMLKVTRNKAAEMIIDVIKSAMANAKHNFKMDSSKLYVSRAYINAGPIIKRLEPRARGRSNIIHKKISHISIFLSERSA